MPDSGGIIQAIELAPDGVVEQIYPLANNEQAVGLDLIHDEERGKNTTLAKPLNMPLVKATIAKFTQHSTTV